MKLNPKYILRDIAGETILISLNDISAPKRLLCLNEMGRAIYNLLKEGNGKDAIIAALLNEYDIDEATLRSDIDEFFSILSEHEVIIETEL